MITAATGLGDAKLKLREALESYQLLVEVDGFEFKVQHPQGKFSLSFLPGNRRVLISHGSKIYPEHRGKGIGKQMLVIREECAKLAGVNLLLATVRNDNAAEMHLLLTHGWLRFTCRTESEVSLWAKELR